MRNYDLSLIFDPFLSDQEINDALQQLASLVQEKGGILGEQDNRGKKPLLAPINKYTEGILVSFQFSILPEHIAEVEKTCKDKAKIIRFFLAQPVRKSTATHSTIASSSRKKQETQEEVAVSSAAPAETTETHKEEKIDLKDIDEKLEEIFKES